jgi:ATP phosphoribosyltransferase-like protein
LQQVGYQLHEPDARGYCGCSGGVEFFQRDRRMVPLQVARSFDAGLTGRDLVLASGILDLRMVMELCFSRKSNQPTRWVLASQEGQLPSGGNIVVGCEYPVLAQALLRKKALPCSFTTVAIEGTEEQAIADGICTHILVVTETGGSLRRAGLQIVEGCENLLVSVPLIVAKPALSPQKERSLQCLSIALETALAADERVMVEANIQRQVLATLRLPAADAPTIMPLDADGLVAVKVCIPATSIAEVLLLLHEVGATAITVQDLKGFLK